MRKILVTGAHSTGKTTLIGAITNDLTKRGLRIAAVSDVARNCPFPIGLSQRENGTMWLLHQQLAAEIGAEATQPDYIVCDRGIPDILAHWSDIRIREPVSYFVDQLKPYMKLWAQTYTLVFRSQIDPQHDLAADGLRETDPTYRVHIERLIERELKWLGLSPYILPVDLESARKIVETMAK
jgi:predicted ATPase